MIRIDMKILYSLKIAYLTLYFCVQVKLKLILRFVFVLFIITAGTRTFIRKYCTLMVKEDNFKSYSYM